MPQVSKQDGLDEEKYQPERSPGPIGTLFAYLIVDLPNNMDAPIRAHPMTDQPNPGRLASRSASETDECHNGLMHHESLKNQLLQRASNEDIGSHD